MRKNKQTSKKKRTNRVFALGMTGVMALPMVVAIAPNQVNAEEPTVPTVEAGDTIEIGNTDYKIKSMYNDGNYDTYVVLENHSIWTWGTLNASSEKPVKLADTSNAVELIDDDYYIGSDGKMYEIRKPNVPLVNTPYSEFNGKTLDDIKFLESKGVDPAIFATMFTQRYYHWSGSTQVIYDVRFMTKHDGTVVVSGDYASVGGLKTLTYTKDTETGFQKMNGVPFKGIKQMWTNGNDTIGYDRTMILDNEGSLYAVDTTTSQTYISGIGSAGSKTFVKLDIPDKVRYISKEQYSFTVLTENNDMYVWGGNTEGGVNLGADTGAYKDKPVKILSNVDFVARNDSGYTQIPVTKDGQIYTLGRNPYAYSYSNRSGYTDKLKKVLGYQSADIIKGKVKEVFSSSYLNLVVTDDKTYIYGRNSARAVYPQVVEGLENKKIKKIEGEYVVTEDGELYLIGANTFKVPLVPSDLPQGTDADYVAHKVDISNVTDFHVGYTYANALTADGTLQAWGNPTAKGSGAPMPIFGDSGSGFVKVKFSTLASSVLTNTSVTDTTATFSWTPVDGATSYVLREGANILYEGDETSVTIEDIIPETVHSKITIQALDGDQDSWIGKALSYTASVERPTNFKYKRFTPTNIRLSWDAVAGATGYIIDRTGWEKSLTLASDKLIYDDLVAYDGADDVYTVKAIKGAKVAMVSTLTTAPQLSPTITDKTATSAKVTWSKLDMADTYKVFKDGVEVYDGSGSKFSLTGLTPSKQYEVTVKGYDEDGEEVITSNIKFKTAKIEPINMDSVQVSATDRTATMSFDVVDGAQTYKIIRGDNAWTYTKVSDGVYSVKQTFKGITSGSKPNVTVKDNRITFTDSGTGLVSNTLYNYSVTAGDVNGVLSSPQEVTITTTDELPASVTNFKGTTISKTKGKLSWDAVEDATEYEIYKNDVLIYRGTQPSFTDSKLVVGNQYTYSLYVETAKGKGAENILRYDHIAVDSPTTPTVTAVKKAPDTVELTWTEVDEADSYIVRADGKDLYSGTDTTFTDTTAEEGVDKNYEVVSVVGEVESEPETIVVEEAKEDADDKGNTGETGTGSGETGSGETGSEPEKGEDVVAGKNTKPELADSTPTNIALEDGNTNISITGTVLDKDIGDKVTVKYELNGQEDVLTDFVSEGVAQEYSKTVDVSEPAIASSFARMFALFNMDDSKELSIWAEDDKGNKSDVKVITYSTSSGTGSGEGSENGGESGSGSTGGEEGETGTGGSNGGNESGGSTDTGSGDSGNSETKPSTGTGDSETKPSTGNGNSETKPSTGSGESETKPSTGNGGTGNTDNSGGSQTGDVGNGGSTGGTTPSDTETKPITSSPTLTQEQAKEMGYVLLADKTSENDVMVAFSRQSLADTGKVNMVVNIAPKEDIVEPTLYMYYVKAGDESKPFSLNDLDLLDKVSLDTVKAGDTLNLEVPTKLKIGKDYSVAAVVADKNGKVYSKNELDSKTLKKYMVLNSVNSNLESKGMLSKLTAKVSSLFSSK